MSSAPTQPDRHEAVSPGTPTLIVVGGPPGSGKTTLAHALARELGCPAICRDEIKEGMVHAHGGDFQAAAGDPLTQRTLSVFFDVLRLLVAAGVSTVAEASFQDRLWRHGLEPIAGLARLRIVHCTVEPAVAHGRYVRRGPRAAHAAIVGRTAEDWRQAYASFDRVSLAAPSMEVDTSDGYVPGLAEIVAFVDRR
jgi:predicted kinase